MFRIESSNQLTSTTPEKNERQQEESNHHEYFQRSKPEFGFATISVSHDTKFYTAGEACLYFLVEMGEIFRHPLRITNSSQNYFGAFWVFQVSLLEVSLTRNIEQA